MRLCEYESCSNPVFGTDKLTQIGYCKNHQRHRTDLDKRSIVQKALSRSKPKIKSIDKFRSKIEYDLKVDIFHELEKWYSDIAHVIDKNPYCWNCGEYIAKPFYRAATAHIIPKRKNYGCPSVKTHASNYLVLGAGCGCHAKFDTCWEYASQMKIWPVAVERFKAIYPSISKFELKNVPEILTSYVEFSSAISI